MKRLLSLFLAAAGIAFAQPTVPLSNVRIQGTNNQVNSASSLLAASGGTLGISNGGTFTFNTSSLFSGDAPAFRAAIGAGTGTGSVTSVSVVTANGVSGSVATATTTPAITLTLGAITPTTVNGLTISPTSGTLSLANSSTHATVGAFTSTFTFTGTTGVTFPTSGTLATTGGSVPSIQGTANQVLVNATSGSPVSGTAITLTTPQDIAATSTPTFASLTLSSPLTGASGGTGVSNSGKTITLGGNLTTSGAFATTLTATATTALTMPTTGTLATLAGAEALTNKTYNGNTWTTGTGTLTLGSSTINVAGNLTTSGAFGSTFTMTGTTAVTFPTSGTLATTGGSVPSIQGTANQVLVNGTSGSPVAGSAVTLTTPQDIATSSSPTFANVTVPTSLLVGTSTAPSLNGSASVFTTVDTAATLPRGISNVQYSTDANSANFSGYKARGTQASPTIIAASDILTNFRAWGYDGSGVSAGYLNMGSLRFRVPSGATPAATSVPTEAVISIGTNATPSVLTDTIVASSTTGIALTALGTNQNISLSTNGTGAVTVPNATATSSTTTGAFQVTGGVGIAAGLNVGGAISQGLDPAGTALGTGLHLSDNTRSTVQLDTYSSTAGNGPFILARHAGGTFASPSQTPSSASLFTVSGRGYDNSGAFTTSTASIGYTTSEAFTSSAHGTYIIFSGTTVGTTTLSEISRFVDGNILVGTVSGTGLTGAGGLKLNSSTTSTSTATGSFVTGGGAGIGGPLFVGTSGATISGGAGNMTIVAGTGNSRTMTLQTTTSGGTATTFLSGDASQNTTISKKVVSYNSINTVTNGVPSLLATIDTTGLTANVAASTLYAVPAAGEGMYRVSAMLVTTTAASVSSTMPNAQVVYTDKDSNTSVTLDATPVLGAAGLGQSGLLTANAVGTVFTGVTVIYVKASTTIQYQTVNYVSTASGMTYAIRIRLEAI